MRALRASLVHCPSVFLERLSVAGSVPSLPPAVMDGAAVTQFMSLTGTDAETARLWLAASAGTGGAVDVQAALSIYFEAQGSGGPPPSVATASSLGRVASSPPGSGKRSAGCVPVGGERPAGLPSSADGGVGVGGLPGDVHADGQLAKRRRT